MLPENTKFSTIGFDGIYEKSLNYLIWGFLFIIFSQLKVIEIEIRVIK